MSADQLASQAEAQAEAEAELLARFQTVRHQAELTGDPDGLQRLLDLAAGSSWPRPQVTLLIECAVQEIRSRGRQAADSVSIWRDLRGRAERSLPAGDSTALRIRSQLMQHVRRCGREQDLSEAIRLAGAELTRSEALFGADDHRTATARTQLAVALSDRGQPADLRRAQRMLHQEACDRDRRFGARHPFTWTVLQDLAQTLVRLAESGIDQASHATRAESLARTVALARSERFGLGDLQALKADLVHAHALILLGRHASASDQIRYVMAVARRASSPLDPGLAERLLATAQAAEADPAALRTAQCALRISAACFPADSRPVRLALDLVDQLQQLP